MREMIARRTADRNRSRAFTARSSNSQQARRRRASAAHAIVWFMRTTTSRNEWPAGAPSSDAAAVRALYAQLMDGWNAGSGEAFAAPFADKCDFVAFDGTRFSGREAIARFHEPLFKTHLKGTRLAGDVTDVRWLSPTVALMHARGGTIPRGRTRPAPERDSVQTLVAARVDGAWRLVAFQNTRVRPIGQNLRGTLLWLTSDWLWRWCLPRVDPAATRSTS
jgi:uncharacterized protein (TIGR02246 family)